METSQKICVNELLLTFCHEHAFAQFFHNLHVSKHMSMPEAEQYGYGWGIPIVSFTPPILVNNHTYCTSVIFPCIEAVDQFIENLVSREHELQIEVGDGRLSEKDYKTPVVEEFKSLPGLTQFYQLYELSPYLLIWARIR